MMQVDSQTLTLLLVDDDDVAREAVIRSLNKHEVSYPVVEAGNGLEALELLRGTNGAPGIASPVIVLLDLNMPRMDGFEFLQELRGDEALAPTVVFVLTTSSSDYDRNRAYQENIAGYMVKAAVGPQFKKLSALLNHYGQAVSLP